MRSFAALPAPLLRLLLPLLIALLAGCATPLPIIERDKIASEAIPASPTTTLSKIVANSTPGPDAHSGFRLLPLGSFSFDTRLQLARRAEVSLDVQYYHFEGDETGRALLRALRDAALRGVRVRLLLDDFYTGGHDDLFLALAAHPNVQLRLFNPFCCARGSGSTTRFLASFGDWGRVNHRMHNKLFVADGIAAVIGGRNIANEYYLRGESDNFVDLDAFVVGKMIEPLAALFDRYWNSDAVYPYEAVARASMDAPALRAYFDDITGLQKMRPLAPLPPNDILGYGPIGDDLEDGRLGLIWGEGYVFADHPDKPFDGSVGGELLETSVTYNVIEAMKQAKSEVVISSPYFIPGAAGMEFIRELRKRGVKLSVMTNSLGATDEPLVHLGYSRYRPEMLRLGVELYELSSQRVKRNKRLFHFGESLGRLHAKLAVVDKRVSFIGSMNFDPRSATINTELGAVIDSPALARELQRVIDLDRLQSAYRVRFKADGSGLEWLGTDEEGDMVLNEEPDSSLWLRFKLWLLSPLVPEELL
ncbi:phospholipase D family protein [Aquincola sp. S2]|uniref:Phospholipase D family protein n=1 Tax=Pseudaquabacterium terrae TaxID=2732868 RepID=A0ABX2ERY7_9BURK|nr:phospholipase D family protein [Aquabacterium terrae]NRF71450.1 phospholipase D family protein [Aquabacterium terrae]